MPFAHAIPNGILQAWRDAEIQTVENHLAKCEKPFTACHACASIVLLISEGRFIVQPSPAWAEGLDLR